MQQQPKEPQFRKKSPFGTDNFERNKPSTIRILIMTLAIVVILILIGYFFGK